MFDLSVFFRAQRYYIQGSLIVSESYAAAKDYLEQTLATPDICLREVGFRSFLDSGASVVASTKANEAQKEAALGYIDFVPSVKAIESGTVNVKERLLLVGDMNKTAPRRDDSAKVIANFVDAGEKVYQCDFTPSSENLVDGFFRGVIEVTKKAHTLAFEGCTDILFMGLRKWDFPISDEQLINQPGRHSLQIGSVMGKSGRGMTINHLTTTLAGGQVFKGVITFSFAEPV